MYCARGVSVNIRLIPCRDVSYPCLAVTPSYIDNNFNVPGFWRVAKARYF